MTNNRSSRQSLFFIHRSSRQSYYRHGRYSILNWRSRSNTTNWHLRHCRECSKWIYSRYWLSNRRALSSRSVKDEEANSDHYSCIAVYVNGILHKSWIERKLTCLASKQCGVGHSTGQSFFFLIDKQIYIDPSQSYCCSGDMTIDQNEGKFLRLDIVFFILKSLLIKLNVNLQHSDPNFLDFISLDHRPNFITARRKIILLGH